MALKRSAGESREAFVRGRSSFARSVARARIVERGMEVPRES